MRLSRLSSLSTLLLAAACGGSEGDDAPPPGTSQQPLQCEGAEYVAFDAANHASQDLRLSAFTQMVDKMKASYAEPFDATAAARLFAEAETLYETTASLRAKVQGRKDHHLSGEPAAGTEIDAAIMAGFAAGKTSTTSLSAKLAKQKVEKSLVRFFYLSVHYEMIQGGKKYWDEAYGYFGSGSANAESTRRGLAAVATSRDTKNGTNLEAEIFNALVDGSCELAKALEARKTDQIDWKTVPELKAIIESADRKMQQVLAYSAGHEAYEMSEIAADLPANPELSEDMWVKLAELDPYFAAIEGMMLERGGESKARAERIRQKIDAAWAAQPSESWMTGFDAQGVVEDLNAEFGIDIKG